MNNNELDLTSETNSEELELSVDEPSELPQKQTTENKSSTPTKPTQELNTNQNITDSNNQNKQLKVKKSKTKFNSWKFLTCIFGSASVASLVATSICLGSVIKIDKNTRQYTPTVDYDSEKIEFTAEKFRQHTNYLIHYKIKNKQEYELDYNLSTINIGAFQYKVSELKYDSVNETILVPADKMSSSDIKISLRAQPLQNLTINFTNGGDTLISFVGDTTISVQRNTKWKDILNKPTPVKHGNILKFWMDPSTESSIEPDTPITNHLSVYPLMVPDPLTPTITIKFEPEDPNQEVYFKGDTSPVVPYGSPFAQIPKPEVLCPEGYHFKEWINQDTGVVISDNQVITKSITVSPRIEEAYHLSFEDENGTLLFEIDIAKGSKWKDVTSHPNYQEPPAKAGHTVFWQIDDPSAQPISPETEIDDDWLLVPHYVPTIYQITFKLTEDQITKGAIMEETIVKNIEYGTKFKDIQKPPVTSYPNFEHSGWTIDDNWEITANMVVNPVFSPKPPVVKEKTVGVYAAADSKILPTFNGLTNLKLYCSKDGDNWSEIEDNKSIDIPAGTSLYLRGENVNGLSTSDSNFINFKLAEGKIQLNGNIMNLINYNNPPTEIPNSNCFINLFKDSSAITKVSDGFLPATTLKIGCYASMFEGCYNLTSAPELPSTSIPTAAYSNMFANCSLLTNIKQISAGSFGDTACISMFKGCSSLKVSKNQTSKLILDLSLVGTIFGSHSFKDMFKDTAGTFTGTPAYGDKLYLQN